MGNIVLMVISILVGIWLLYQGIWFTVDIFFDIDINEYFNINIENLIIKLLPITCFGMAICFIAIGILIGLGKM